MSDKIIFLGAKPIGYQCFSHLIEHADALNLEISGLLTRCRPEFQTHDDLTALAAAHHIPVLTSLAEIPDCDFLYSVQYHELLPAATIRKAAKKAVNLHLAPLPEYRGCNQFSFAIMDEVDEFGVSIHEIDERIDHGTVLFEKRFPVAPRTWVASLYEETVRHGFELFCNTLPLLLAGDYAPVPPAPHRPSSLHFRHEIHQLKKIPLDLPASEIEKRIRATCMPGFPPPYCEIDGKRLTFEMT